MKQVIRKNDILPSHLDPERFEAIFWHIRDNPESPQSKRVEEILELLSSLRKGLRTEEKMRILTRLRNVLRAYTWVARVSHTTDGFYVTRVIAGGESQSEDDRWECEAVRDLLDIVPYLGDRPRIRRCAQCNDWFFAANRQDQEYCSGNCRQRHYDSDPAMRKRKRRYMREYRNLTSRRVFH